MVNIMAGSLGGLFPTLQPDRLEVVSVVINNLCNLRCGHCYLEPEPTTRDSLLNPNEWGLFFRSLFRDLAPSVLCIAGKEPFLTEESTGLVVDTIRLRDLLQRDQAKRTHIGVITNGTTMGRFKELICETPPDHFDISVDGLPDVHDSVRGHGAFAALEKNLEWVSKLFRERVWITHTLLSSNLERLSEFVLYMNQNLGLQRFSVGLYRDLSYTSQALALPSRELPDALGNGFERLAEVPLSSDVELVIEIGIEHHSLLSALRKRGWISSDDPITSSCWSFRNGLTLRLNSCKVATGLWRSVRVTPEGYWLAAEDLVFAKEYSRRAVGRLRDYRYDARRLYEVGIEHPRLTELLSEGEFASFPQGVVSTTREG